MQVAPASRLAKGLRYGLASGLLLGLPALSAAIGHAQQPPPVTCGSGDLRPQVITVSTSGGVSGDNQPDLVVNGACTVKSGADYYYGKVNIVAGGTLLFKEGQPSDIDKVTNFWARSVIVENGGTLQAGTPETPYGTNLQTLNIILYGRDQSGGDPANKAAGGDTCVQANCGVPQNIWDSNGNGQPLPLGNGVTDYFYTYAPIYGTTTGFYGYKVLAAGFGGTLQLYGKKGATGAKAADADPTSSGTSWIRLAGGEKAGDPLRAGGKTLRLDRAVETDWQPGDKIVVTTTDYLPSHSEELTLDTVQGNTVTTKEAARWRHVGKAFDLSRLTAAGDGFKRAFTDGGLTVPKSAETRAAVALLTRSIRIVSGGDFAGDYFDCTKGLGDTFIVPKSLSHDRSKDATVTKDKCATARNSSYSFGAHTKFRQGFKKLQLQGVEFHQMGQGGRLAHYPVHFHMARQVPPDTYVKDSSVSESMTRWYVLHSTLGVTLQRDVGWKSIGHGYYLEDGTESDNKFYSNIGIFARAGVRDDPGTADPRDRLNPRNIPGILANTADPQGTDRQHRSDIVYPSVFWITNGWNEFVGNMAAGAGACGICYWFLAFGNNDMIETNPISADHKNLNHMKWSGYAGRQITTASVVRAGETPIKSFFKNYCTTAMHSLTTGDGISQCLGVASYPFNDQTKIQPVKSIAPPPVAAASPQNADHYYPNYISGNRKPTVCKDGTTNCDVGNTIQTPSCDNGTALGCGTTIIDSYTSSFHWAETNFSAIWLRTPGWFLVDNSFLSDVQNGGLTFVTGGDYSRSSTAVGYWGLVRRSVFAGSTQRDNPFAYATGPRKAASGDADTGCAFGSAVNDQGLAVGLCVRKDQGIYFPLSNWATGQRLFNIYDGPAHQDANAYLDINVSDCGGSVANDNDKKSCMYLGTPGVRKFLADFKDKKKGQGYLPNAAIGWKQPNGFYYPPAFHSKNLFFDNVDIRHYVILPLFKPGSYQTDDQRVQNEFYGIRPGTTGLMTGFTDIDRQTVLNDDDGTLTGFTATSAAHPLTPTISINEDGFFAAPLQVAQCKSNVGVTPDVACASPPSPKRSATAPTARTSPYDYVTTIIYPDCAMQKVGGPMPPGFPWACSIASVNTIDPKFDNKGNRWITKLQRGGTWSRDCASGYCFGVPIYRQYLTGDQVTDNGGPDGNVTDKSTREWKTWSKCNTPTTKKPDPYPDDRQAPRQIDVVNEECDFPFARMAGANEWQRNVLTVDHGKYYIDTTRSAAHQRHSVKLGDPNDLNATYVECDYKRANGTKTNPTSCEQRSINLFEGGQTYYVFLMFAKPNTKQKYQIYVSDKFDKNTLKGVKIVGVEGAFQYDDWPNAVSWSNANAALVGKMIEGSTKGVNDVLEVSVDFSKAAGISFDPAAPTNKPQICKPLSFCSGDGAKCGCNLDPKDPRLATNPGLKAACDKTCSEWAVKDLDAPAWKPQDPNLPGTARLGFAFTLPKDGFKADNSYRRPKPEPFPLKEHDGKDSAWKLIKLKQAVAHDAGDCAYTQVPGQTPQCNVPDCAPGMGPPPFCDKPTAP